MKEHRYEFDFAQLKRQVTMEMVLTRYRLVGTLRGNGHKRYGACPIHHGKNPRQFHVDLSKGSGTWFCFGDCKRGGGVIDFVAAIENVSVPKAASMLAGWFAIPPKRRPRTKGTADE